MTVLTILSEENNSNTLVVYIRGFLDYICPLVSCNCIQLLLCNVLSAVSICTHLADRQLAGSELKIK